MGNKPESAIDLKVLDRPAAHDMEQEFAAVWEYAHN